MELGFNTLRRRSIPLCVILALVLDSVFGLLSFGSETYHTLQTQKGEYRWIREDSRWRVFGSGLVGYGVTPTQDFIHVPDGDQYLLSGVLSYEMPHWVHDMGLGWMNSNLRTKTEDGRQLTIRTRAAVAQYGVRYRLGKRWQIGPEFNLAYGTDTSFKASIGPNSITPFLGARFVYEMPVHIFPLRFVTQAMTDLNLEGRRAIFGMVGIEFGVPVGLPKYMHTASNITTNGDQMRIQLDPEYFHFYTASDEISEDGKSFIQDLVELLKANKDNWSEIEIAGHADQRGSRAMNVRLSKHRANKIAKILKSEGFDNSKMHVVGYGYDRPLDPEMNRVAWAKNRRAELVIDGVKDPDSLKEKLSTFEDQLRDRTWESKQ